MFRIQFKRYIIRKLIAKIAELYKINVKTKLIKKKISLVLKLR